ncbi:MAG TPA: M15 family metallopeptidase [Gaiellaceae bacterium]|nr:M15 family metallopeptidase [Gaiellaceae bacterium]
MIAAPAAQPPPFVARAAPVTRADVRWSWRPGCPVPPSRLRAVRLAYWDFAGERRLGTLVVNETAVPAVERVFRTLYRARFPIRSIRPVDAFHGSDDRSMAADNTSGFNCRKAVTSGPASWSAHAYGLAVDVNTVENPYRLGGRWLPAAGRRFADRARIRPGMAVAGGLLVRAFAEVGWGWGGRWSDPDYQHFSATGN